eukprot:CAMPEP_0183435886 /NCGR_PEP_ID=MMETSP0370-20130417/68898_1 /TAXON_ID=268820 /ORGANISM="Peridinium aciculiferum, Strain PAER-2" /LENGTH=116 /DNA_ID=CAMNT_0025623145 /DNA_START=132 /DNA_END=482 /DNA_ORIENTATION=-
MAVIQLLSAVLSCFVALTLAALQPPVVWRPPFVGYGGHGEGEGDELGLLQREQVVRPVGSEQPTPPAVGDLPEAALLEADEEDEADDDEREPSTMLTVQEMSVVVHQAKHRLDGHA